MNIEEKFAEFRKTVNEQQFNDLSYLQKKSEEIRPVDAELADRILLRIDRVTRQNNENRFNAFKNEIGKEKFANIAFLSAKAQQFESSEPDLAKRILDHIDTLKKLSPPTSERNPVTIEQQAKPLIALSSNAKDAEKNSPSSKKTSSKPVQQKIKQWLQAPFVVLVILPTLLFAAYQTLWASERYESQAKVIVQQPDASATMDASMAILSGLGVSSNSASDKELVKAYIYSNDMLEYLDQTLSMTEHYKNIDIDYFSRIHDSDSKEDILEYYQKHVKIEINDKSGVISIYIQAFNSEFAQAIANKIVERAEWYINSIGHQLAQAQLAFIQHEHQLVENKLEQAQTQLLNFQQQHNLLDPNAEGLAMQQITYQLEGQITAKEAELKNLQSIMSTTAPRVVALQTELSALKEQLLNERSKLAQNDNNQRSVSEIMAQFTDLKVKVELALQAYTSSQISLEKSRIEAYRQLKYLIVVESATQPEKSKYPDVPYNISLFAILISMLFAIGKIIISTIRELK